MSSGTDDISELTETQQEALQTYTSITDQDPIAALPLLRRAEWNVQIAVTRFFEGEPTTDPLAEARSAIPPPASRQTANLQYESLLASTNPARAPVSDASVSQVDTSSTTLAAYQSPFFLTILLTPFNILYRVLSTIFAPFSFLVPSLLRRLFANLFNPPRPSRRHLPPQETAHRFIREFNEEYPSDLHLPWAETGFNLALNEAKSKQSFLLVVLLSPSHDETATWVRDMLQSQTFHGFLNSHRDELSLWGGNVRDQEAYMVSGNLKCTKFPFVALICQTPPSPTSTTAAGGPMSVVLQCVGPLTATELTAKLGTSMTSHRAALRAARAQEVDRRAQHNLRQEQDSAYERSLAQDRERARKKREEEEAQLNAEKEAARKLEEVEMQRRKKEQWKHWRAQRIAPEPAADVKDAIRIQIRTREGERIVRKFAPDSQIEDLYAFVECRNVVDSIEKSGERPEETDQPDVYEHDYRFVLVSPMPRKVYGLDQAGSLPAILGRSANLVVEAIDEEDEADDEIVGSA